MGKGQTSQSILLYRAFHSHLAKTASDERRPDHEGIAQELSLLEAIDAGRARGTKAEIMEILVSIYYHRLCLCWRLADDARVAGMLATWEVVEAFLECAAAEALTDSQ